MRKWLKIIEDISAYPAFVDHLRQATENAQVGFYFEEGGCWGMALALERAFLQDGHQATLCVTDGFVHAAIQSGEHYFDYTGMTKLTNARRVDRRAFIKLAFENGCTAGDLRADFNDAAEIVENAKELAED